MSQRIRHRSEDSAALVRILEEGVAAHTLVKSDGLHAYTGFVDFSALLAGGGFLPMNGNRAVDRAVVAGRVEDNLKRLREGRPLADFGQILLVVVASGPPDWLVMDGQHRLAAMRELHASHGVDVHFQFRAKVVRDEAEAHAHLMLYQDQHAPDPRTFFPDRRQTGLAEGVLASLRKAFPASGLWPEGERPAIGRRPGLRAGDVSRPLLSNNIALGILGSAGLLRDEAATVDSVMERLLAANEVLRGRPRAGLGRPSVTAAMRGQAARLGCFLGFLREGKLEYAAIREEVDARLAAAAASAAAERESKSPCREGECQICFDAPKTHLFKPCGHWCACAACAAAIAGGERSLCPICRQVTTGTQRVYL